MIYTLLNELSSTNSRLEKERLLLKNDSGLLRQVLLATLNPYINYYIKQVRNIEIVEIEKSLNYLKIVLSQITTQQSCPICLEIIDDLAITDCGHVFCSNCIEKCLQVNGKCPNCRTNTKYTIVSMNPNTNLLNINKYGTHKNHSKKGC